MLPAEQEVFEGRLKKERVLLAALNAEKRARGIKVEPNKNEIMTESETIKEPIRKPIAWGAAVAFLLLVGVVLMYWYWVV